MDSVGSQSARSAYAMYEPQTFRASDASYSMADTVIISAAGVGVVTAAAVQVSSESLRRGDGAADMRQRQ